MLSHLKMHKKQFWINNLQYEEHLKYSYFYFCIKDLEPVGLLWAQFRLWVETPSQHLNVSNLHIFKKIAQELKQNLHQNIFQKELHTNIFQTKFALNHISPKTMHKKKFQFFWTSTYIFKKKIEHKNKKILWNHGYSWWFKQIHCQTYFCYLFAKCDNVGSLQKILMKCGFQLHWKVFSLVSPL